MESPYSSLNSSLNFDFVKQWSPIPPRALNGGLYTGEPFAPGAKYANFPVKPTAAYWVSENLKSANPPSRALSQLQAGYRPENNTDDQIPDIGYFRGDFATFGPLNTYCILEKNCILEKKEKH